MRYISLLLATALSGAAIADDAKKSDTDWNFKGQGVFYYQTFDNWGNGSWFDQGPKSDSEGFSTGGAGLQLFAENKDLVNGLGAGFELTGISSLGLEEDVVSGLAQNAGGLNDAAITQAYLTYAVKNTSFKWGRQHLPKSLSPFAFTEGWNMFKNSFEGLLVVNTDIKDTTLVYASVAEHNNSVGDLTSFSDFHTAKGAANMITAQNKSVKNLTLTGSYYWIPDAVWANGSYVTDAEALWLDAGYKMEKGLSFGLQGGYIGGISGADDTNAFGAKVAGKIKDFNWSAAYSSAGDGALNVSNLAGAGVKSPLYTQGVLNQNAIKRDSDTFRFTLSTGVYGGTFTAAYSVSDMGDTALPTVFGQGVGGAGDYSELDLIFVKMLNKQTKLFLGYINQNDDRQIDDSQNVFRVWARYNF